jgi:hypothetical protein
VGAKRRVNVAELHTKVLARLISVSVTGSSFDGDSGWLGILFWLLFALNQFSPSLRTVSCIP